MCVCSSSLTSPQPFFVPGTGFLEDNFTTDWSGVGLGWGGGFRMIQGH